MKLGERVKQRRIDLKLSQQTLAKDIATQSQISKIEKNELQPGSQLLYNMSRRLNCSMDYLFNGNELDNQFEQKMKVIERLLNKQDYDALIPLLDGNYLSNGSTDEIAAIKWVRAMIAKYKYDHLDEAIENIDESYDLLNSSMYERLQVSICDTKARFHFEKGNNDVAKAAIEQGLQIAKRYNVDEKYTIHLLYLLSNMNLSEKDFDRCLAYAQAALDLTIKSNNYELYSEIVYNIVKSKIEMGINNDSDVKQLDVALYLSDASKKYNVSILIRDLMRLQ